MHRNGTVLVDEDLYTPLLEPLRFYLNLPLLGKMLVVTIPVICKSVTVARLTNGIMVMYRANECFQLFIFSRYVQNSAVWMFGIQHSSNGEKFVYG
jgi:hypothetical protein